MSALEQRQQGPLGSPDATLAHVLVLLELTVVCSRGMQSLYCAKGLVSWSFRKSRGGLCNLFTGLAVKPKAPGKKGQRQAVETAMRLNTASQTVVMAACICTWWPAVHTSWGPINLFQLTESLDNRSPLLHHLHVCVLLEAAPYRQKQTVGRGNKQFP